METASQNLIKYSNYQEQFKRLNKALKSQFYLEAIFIEYAILEDRTKSILRHSNCSCKGKNEGSLFDRVEKIREISIHGSLPARYFDEALLDSILVWKNERNDLIHALMKRSLTTEELQMLAADGYKLARILANKSTNYTRALERRSKNK